MASGTYPWQRITKPSSIARYTYMPRYDHVHELTVRKKMSPEYRINVIQPGPRPPYYMVAEYLWGYGCDIDSDGNSIEPQDRQWTELTIELRGTEGKKVDIDPVSLAPLVLQVRADSLELAEKTAEFIVKQSGGEIQYFA